MTPEKQTSTRDEGWLVTLREWSSLDFRQVAAAATIIAVLIPTAVQAGPASMSPQADEKVAASEGWPVQPVAATNAGEAPGSDDQVIRVGRVIWGDRYDAATDVTTVP